MKSETEPVYTVLLVDDDPISRELLETVLEGAGYKVLSAEDALQGIDLAKTHHPDIILMDVQLPGTDGLEATRLLKKDMTTANIPVVAVTAHAKPEDASRSLEAGCALHLAKPINTRELPKNLKQLLTSLNVGWKP